MAKETPKAKKVPRPRAVRRLMVTHVSLMPNGTFELGVKEPAKPTKAKAKPTAKRPRKET